MINMNYEYLILPLRASFRGCQRKPKLDHQAAGIPNSYSFAGMVKGQSTSVRLINGIVANNALFELSLMSQTCLLSAHPHNEV